MPRAPSLQKLVGNLALKSCSSSPSGISLGCSCNPALLSALVAQLPSRGFLLSSRDLKANLCTLLSLISHLRVIAAFRCSATGNGSSFRKGFRKGFSPAFLLFLSPGSTQRALLGAHRCPSQERRAGAEGSTPLLRAATAFLPDSFISCPFSGPLAL